MATEETDRTRDDTAPWTAASESLRSVVKWIAASFGALGALLIGTAPLSGLSNFAASEWQQWLPSIAFGAIALTAVAYIVWQATTLLTPSTITLPEVRTDKGFHTLRDIVAADPTAYLGLWGADIDTFMTNRQTEFRALSKIDEEIASLPDGDNRLQALQSARPLLLRRVAACGVVSARLLAIAAFHDLAQRFSRAKRRIFAAAAVVVVGVAGFVATTPGAASTADGEHRPQPALVSLTTSGESSVRPLIGAKCPKPFKAVLLSGSAEGPWQILVASPECTAGTLELTTEQAAVLSVFS